MELPAVRRTQPSSKGSNFFNTHVQLLQWLHGKQQQQPQIDAYTPSFGHQEGGNDYEIFADPRTIGHTVTGPDDTIAQLSKILNL